MKKDKRRRSITTNGDDFQGGYPRAACDYKKKRGNMTFFVMGSNPCTPYPSQMRLQKLFFIFEVKAIVTLTSTRTAFPSL